MSFNIDEWEPKTKMGKIDFKKLQNEEFEEKEKKDA